MIQSRVVATRRKGKGHRVVHKANAVADSVCNNNGVEHQREGRVFPGCAIHPCAWPEGGLLRLWRDPSVAKDYATT